MLIEEVWHILSFVVGFCFFCLEKVESAEQSGIYDVSKSRDPCLWNNITSTFLFSKNIPLVFVNFLVVH
jgi:hypothetical protein